MRRQRNRPVGSDYRIEQIAAVLVEPLDRRLVAGRQPMDDPGADSVDPADAAEIDPLDRAADRIELGRASCRERVSKQV